MTDDPRFGPDPDLLHPIPAFPRVVFVRNLPLPQGVEVGAYSYYDDPGPPDAFLGRILHHYPFLDERLVIGKFCAMATGTTFLMNGGNHRTSAPSTYPFQIFGGDWVGRFEGEMTFPIKGDTLVGNDVWMGHDCLIMPGVTIGDGAIVGAKAVVARDVPPYAVVVGNPARVVKMRYDEATVARLLKIRWWDWDIAEITRNLPAISGGDPAALERAV